MMITDPLREYAVPLTKLPLVPDGAPLVWLCSCSVHLLECYCYTCSTWPTAHLNLAPPRCEDGIPVYLDAFRWAMIALAKKLNARIPDIDNCRIGHNHSTKSWEIIDNTYHSYCTILQPSDIGYEPYNPNFSQARIVLAAALSL